VLAPPLSELAEQVVGIDLTLAALREASAACPRAGFAQGAAEHLPAADDCFDAAVLRLALHHVEEPQAVLREVRRILRPGGRLVVLDILTSVDPETAALHNAIERLRDPSHTALLPGPVLGATIDGCGLPLVSETTFETTRDFEEWARIIAEPVRMRALERVLRHLARAGVDAGIDLREEGDALRFSYRWGLFVAERPS
jgi:SAM-dependent methyltransferase